MKTLLTILTVFFTVMFSSPSYAGGLDGRAIYCLEKNLTSPQAIGFVFRQLQVEEYKIVGYSILLGYTANYSEKGTTEVFWRGLQNTRVSLDRKSLKLRIAQLDRYQCEISSKEAINSKLLALIEAAKKKNKI